MRLLRHRISVGPVCWCFTLLFIIHGFCLIQAQDPIGAPDEAWVTSSVGETLYVGQDVALQIYLANSQELGGFALQLGITPTDGAMFQTVPRPDSLSEWANFVTLNLDSRFWGEALEFPQCTGWQDDSAVLLHVGAISFGNPHVGTGPLQHALNIHIRPTLPGKIYVDSTMMPPGDSPILRFITPLGNVYEPAWNGPFEFTVLEAPPGDVNGDGVANVADAVYLINWIFRSGPEPRR